MQRWEHDVWYRIIEAVLADHPDQVHLADLPGFDQPAVSRYAATTPNLLAWYRSYNQGRLYREQVRPFGFLLAYHPQSSLASGGHAERIHDGQPKRIRRQKHKQDLPRAVAPYHEDERQAVHRCFDQLSGQTLSPSDLMTYRQALLPYHLQPEAKFENGRPFDREATRRRHVIAVSVTGIGKEANRWEEQFYLGRDPEAQVEYHTARVDTAERVAGERIADLLGEVSEQCRTTGLRAWARRAGIDPGTLSHVLRGQRKPSKGMISKMEAMLENETAF